MPSSARQGRLAEAESDERRALLGMLGSMGKYNQYTPAFIVYLADVLDEQGRYPEAERLARAAVGICETLGFPNESYMLLYTQLRLAEILIAQKRWKDAAEIYGVIDDATKNWDTERRDYFLTPGRIYMLYNTGQIPAVARHHIRVISLLFWSQDLALQRPSTRRFVRAVAEVLDHLFWSHGEGLAD